MCPYFILITFNCFASENILFGVFFQAKTLKENGRTYATHTGATSEKTPKSLAPGPAHESSGSGPHSLRSWMT
jgi:hypothetical protein